MISTSEIWKDVQGYEGLYQVSSIGRVKSVERTVQYQRLNYRNGVTQTVCQHVPEKIIKPGRSDNHYWFVPLSREGKTSLLEVHRILASAFIPNHHPDVFTDVNHKDGDKSNNSIENLEWCTKQENNLHAAMTGLNPSSIRVLCVETGQEFFSMNECDRKMGMPKGTTSGFSKSGKSYKGYTFRRIR